LEVLLLWYEGKLIGIFASSCTSSVLLSRRTYVVLLERRKSDSKEEGSITYIRWLAPLTNIPT
jgi:hypothetical protein